MIHWYRKIDDARSVAEVLALTCEYLATWKPQELALLPPECRPEPIRTEADIEALHVRLVSAFRDSTAQGEALSALQRLTSFVMRASVRLAQLVETDDPSPAPAGGRGSTRSAAPRKGNGDHELN
jgi:hypothetical protein